MKQYIIKEETLKQLHDTMRSVDKTTDPFPVLDLKTKISNCYYTTEVFHCYVGMMVPNNNVGKDGDVFLLV